MNWVAVFFFLACVVTLVLYCLGTARGFEDDVQGRILTWMGSLGLLQGLAALYGLVIDVFLRRRLGARFTLRFAGRLVSLVVLVLTGFAVGAAALFILVAAAGNVSP